MTERMAAFRQARSWHLRRGHYWSLLGCQHTICAGRVQRLRRTRTQLTVPARKR
jgi:hypothetical protein